jgi:hypothetical protein
MSAKLDCYRLIQEIAVARDIFCRAPGCSEYATAGHHIYGRTNLSTAFDPRYVLGLCVQCHVPWAHKNPDEFKEWVIRWMGEDEYEYGHQLSLTIAKHVDFHWIRDNLKLELAKYKSP